MADKITVEIGVTGNAKVEIKNLNKELESVQKSVFNLDNAFSSFVGNIGANVVGKAFDLASQAVGFFTDTVFKGIDAAKEQEDAINRMNQALISTGQFTPKAAKSMEEFSGQIQKTSKFADEAVLSAAALLQSIAKLDTDGLKKATQGAADLAATLHIDLESAASLVGKALEGNVGALNRYGLSIKAGKTEAETFANVLKALNGLSGAAESQTKTYSGSIAQLKNTYGDLLETVGQAVTENKTLITVFNEAGKILEELDGYLKQNKSSVQDLISNGIILLIQSTSEAVTAIQNITVFVLEMAKAYQFAQTSISAFTDIVTFGLTDAGKRAEESAKAFIAIDEQISKIKNNDGFDRARESLQRLEEAAIASKDANRENADADIAEMERSALRRDEIREEQALKDEELRQKNVISFMEFNDKRASELITENEALTIIDAKGNADRIAGNKAMLDTMVKNHTVSKQKELEIQKKAAQDKAAIDKATTENQINTLNFISTMQTAKTKELAVIGKAAAISRASIDTYVAANAAYAAMAGIPIVGPVLGALAAGLAVTAGLVNVSNIAGIGLATGITEVPAGYPNDTFSARLSSGERVLSVQQNRDLTDFLSGSQNISLKIDALVSEMRRSNRQFVVNVGGRELVNVLQDEIDSGRSLAV